MKLLSFILIILLSLSGLAFFEDSKHIQASKVTMTKSNSQDSKILTKILGQYWQKIRENNLFLRLKDGLKIEHLPDPGLARAKADNRFFKILGAKLKKIDAGKLSSEDYITLRRLEWELNNSIRQLDFYRFQIPVSFYSSPIPGVHRFFSLYGFNTKQDTETYLRLLEEYVNFINTQTRILQYQLNRKIVANRIQIEKFLGFIESFMLPSKESLFYVHKNRLIDGGVLQSDQDIELFQKKIANIIDLRINPALKRMMEFIKGKYFESAPEVMGLGHYPGGKEYYEFLVKYYTSLPLTPEKVHWIGLREIDNLKKELDEIRIQLKYYGDVESFIGFLKTDPQFFLKNREEMGDRMNVFLEEVKKQLPLYFNKIPKAPCLLKPLDPLLEKSMTYGYYQNPTGDDPVGYYYYNASDFDKKNRLFNASAALLLHELLPGHHFQVTSVMENPNLSSDMREFYIPAYSEGWAEYASWVGREMGIYKDPYEECGRILQDLFVTVRLVVDTGLNYYLWTPEKARDFMKKYLILSDGEILSEISRYSSDIPGQALSYKIGLLKILELRENVEKELGSEFDIRRFHDEFLGRGELPFSVLFETFPLFKDKKK